MVIYQKENFKCYRWKLDVRVVIVFLQNVKIVKHHMIAHNVLGSNVIVGQITMIWINVNLFSLLPKWNFLNFNYSSAIPQLIHIFFDWISNHAKLWIYPFLHSIETLLEIRRIWKLLSIIISIRHWKIKTIKISYEESGKNLFFQITSLLKIST